ncbi:MAG: dihydropteroate synthase [Prevotella sp.]
MIHTMNIRGQLINFQKPCVMGILNITPDSFYSGSRKQTEAEVVDRTNQILAEGGKIIDIGAFSTRPGAFEVTEEEEIKRLKWALAIVRREQPNAVVSVDTYRPAVARLCVEEWGADIINDVSEGGLTGIVNTAIHEKESMFETVAKLQVPYILMSVQANMHKMLKAFASEIQQLNALGAKDIILDPGFGFGKTLEENYQDMQKLEQLQIFDLPVLVGISRKSMIYKLLGGDPTTSLNGTTALNMIALQKGTSILRVHDVKECVEVCRIYEQLSANQVE